MSYEQITAPEAGERITVQSSQSFMAMELERTSGLQHSKCLKPPQKRLVVQLSGFEYMLVSPLASGMVRTSRKTLFQQFAIIVLQLKDHSRRLLELDFAH
jgi:tRNA(Phe) wybutosine-synthesizing methylase Tyw3